MTRHRLQLHGALAAALLFGWVAQADAQASRPSISKLRLWCCTTPAVFVTGHPRAVAGYNSFSPSVETGGGAPQSILLDAGDVLSLSAPQSWCNYGACTAPAVAGFKYIKGFAGLENAAATLAASGGPPTAVDYCFNGPGTCSPPATSAGSPMMNGRMTIKPGANKFGGAMSIISDTVPAEVGRWLNSAMAGTPWERVYVDVPWIGGQAAPWKRFSVPAPRTLFSGTTYYYPAPTSPNAYLQVNGAGPFQTGTLSISLTMNFNPQLGPTLALNLKGYDNRTAAGAGHIQMVSGQLYSGRNGASGSNAIGMRLSLAEPGSGAGLVTGALALVLVGLARPRASAGRRERGPMRHPIR